MAAASEDLASEEGLEVNNLFRHYGWIVTASDGLAKIFAIPFESEKWEFLGTIDGAHCSREIFSRDLAELIGLAYQEKQFQSLILVCEPDVLQGVCHQLTLEIEQTIGFAMP